MRDGIGLDLDALLVAAQPRSLHASRQPPPSDGPQAGLGAAHPPAGACSPAGCQAPPADSAKVGLGAALAVHAALCGAHFGAALAGVGGAAEQPGGAPRERAGDAGQGFEPAHAANAVALLLDAAGARRVRLPILYYRLSREKWLSPRWSRVRLRANGPLGSTCTDQIDQPKPGAMQRSMLS